jgi:hypothetical protein
MFVSFVYWWLKSKSLASGRYVEPSAGQRVSYSKLCKADDLRQIWKQKALQNMDILTVIPYSSRPGNDWLNFVFFSDNLRDQHSRRRLEFGSQARAQLSQKRDLSNAAICCARYAICKLSSKTAQTYWHTPRMLKGISRLQCSIDDSWTVIDK